MPILKLARGDEKKELDFELDVMSRLSNGALLAKVVRRSNEIKEMLIRNGHRSPVAIIKRPARPIRGHRRERLSRTRVRKSNS